MVPQSVLLWNPIVVKLDESPEVDKWFSKSGSRISNNLFTGTFYCSNRSQWPIKSEWESKLPWLAVKEEFSHSFDRGGTRHQYIVTKFSECIWAATNRALAQSSQPRVWHSIQRSPHHLVPRATHVEQHPPAVDACTDREQSIYTEWATKKPTPSFLSIQYETKPW